jgi:Na+/H+-translocating membrane pyrophosphatase
MHMRQFFFVTLAGGLLALSFAVFRILWIVRQPVTIDELKKISGIIANGAITFLYREYRVLLPFVAIVAALLGIANRGPLRFQAVSFVVGATCSTLAGYIGMRVATSSNARTTQAATTNDLNPALKVAFSGGSAIGLSVVGLALVGLSSVSLGFTGGFCKCQGYFPTPWKVFSPIWGKRKIPNFRKPKLPTLRKGNFPTRWKVEFPTSILCLLPL